MKKRWSNWRGGGSSSVRKRGKPNTPRTPSFPRAPRSEDSPYYGWNDYFPEDSYIEGSPLATRLSVLMNAVQHLLTDDVVLEQIFSKSSITLNLPEFLENRHIAEGIPDLTELLRSTPDITLRSISLALYHMFCAPRGGTQNLKMQSQIIVRLADHGPSTPLKELRAGLYGKFITVHGTVVRVSDVKPLVTHMMFNCSQCGQNIMHPLERGEYSVPFPCCSTPLVPDHIGAHTIDLQKVRLQEVVSDEQMEAGKIPRTVECELTADLVGVCTPGENVSVTGILKVHHGAEDQRNRNNKDKCMFLLYIHANYVSVSTTAGDSALVIDMTDIADIQSLAQRDPFGALVNSLCPAIFGHTLVKAGLVLALVGGTKRQSNGGVFTKRSDSHVLIVGDPGLGKSQLLQATSNIAPRGVYVCGSSASAAGLTVTLTRDGPDTVLEAGALVLADNGVCCIDEFDKMGTQHSALLQAMEQQVISIAKAGMACSLPARTCVIAAANPVGGHYNSSKTVSENLKMSSALLSRFDLTFILLDRPDAGLDKFLSDHVLALHGGEGSTEYDEWQQDLPLEQRLAAVKEELEPLAVRKYIAHVRSCVHPTLGEEAKDILKQFYLSLRAGDTGDETPVTLRQLESLVRLTQSRARISQRCTASEQDAQDVIEIYKHSMRDVRGPVTGLSSGTKPMGTTKAGKLLVAALNKHSERTGNSIFSVPEIKDVLKRSNINVKSFDSLMHCLNDQGYLLKKGSNVFQLQTSICL